MIISSVIIVLFEVKVRWFRRDGKDKGPVFGRAFGCLLFGEEPKEAKALGSFGGVEGEAGGDEGIVDLGGGEVDAGIDFADGFGDFVGCELMGGFGEGGGRFEAFHYGGDVGSKVYFLRIFVVHIILF